MLGNARTPRKSESLHGYELSALETFNSRKGCALRENTCLGCQVHGSQTSLLKLTPFGMFLENEVTRFCCTCRQKRPRILFDPIKLLHAIQTSFYWDRPVMQTGEQDWRSGLIPHDFLAFHPRAQKLKIKHIYCPGGGRIHQAVSSWLFLVQNAHQTHEKLS